MAQKKLGSLKRTDTVIATSVDLAADVGSSVLPVANGGSGTGSYTNGQLLIGNTTGNTLVKATLTPVANQTTVTNGAGSITIGTVQDIGTGSTPVFAGVDTALITHSGGAVEVRPGSGYDFDITLSTLTSRAHITYATTLGGLVPTLLTLTKNTSGSVSGGEGHAIEWECQTSTTAAVTQAKRSTTWANATHASRTARVIESVYDTSARECLRMEASGSAAMIGFLGAASSPRLVSPDIGTALTTFGFASGTPTLAMSKVSGLGTGVATALAINVGTSGCFVVNGGALGTPSSGTVTNLTGTASININGTVGATTPAAGTFTNLTVNGNTIIGDASGDTITQYASTRRLVSGETITVDSASTTAEVLQTWKLSDDAVGKFEIINSSATDGLFSPTFKGTRAAAGPGINFIGNSTTDTGTNGVLLFQAQIGGGNVSTRPLVDFWNNGTSAFAIAANGDLSQKVVGNGQALTFASQTELLTIAAAATSDTSFNLPAGAVIFAVSVRVTVVIPTASTFTVTGTTSGTTFSTAAVAVAANTTDKGTAAGAYYNASAQHVRITPNLTPAANTGRVRVTAHYYSITAPTS